MSRWSRLYRLPRTQKILYARSCLTLTVVRLGLWVFPLSAVERTAGAWSRRLLRQSSRGGSQVSTADVARALSAAGSVVPVATCLVRSLAGQVMLSAAGHPSTLHLGVTTEEGFEAHAWLESDGEIVSDGAGWERFVSLRSLKVDR